jgi:hypothetical protein
LRLSHQLQSNACRHADPELIITPLARLAVAATAVMARVMASVNQRLPSSGDADGDVARTGWQSVSSAAPSPLTTRADRASLENNEPGVLDVVREADFSEQRPAALGVSSLSDVGAPQYDVAHVPADIFLLGT